MALSDSAAAAAYKKRWIAAHPGQEKKWSLSKYMGRIAKAKKASTGPNATRDAGYVERTKAALAGTRAPTLVKTKTTYDRTIGDATHPGTIDAQAAWLKSREGQPDLGVAGNEADYTKFVGEGGGWKGIAKEVPNVNAQAREFRKNVKGSKFSDWEDRVKRAEKAEASGAATKGYADRTRAQLAAGKVKGALPSQLKKVATTRAAVTTKAAAPVTAKAPTAAQARQRADAAADWAKNHKGKKATTAQINAVVRSRTYPPAG